MEKVLRQSRGGGAFVSGLFAALALHGGVAAAAYRLAASTPLPTRAEDEMVVTLVTLPRTPDVVGNGAPPAPEAESGASAAPTSPQVTDRETVPVSTARTIRPKEAPKPVETREVETAHPTVNTAPPPDPGPIANSTGPVANPVGASNGGTGASTGTGTGNGAGTGSGTGNALGIAARPATTAEILPFGAGMTRPTLVSKIEPTYTREALEARVEGLMLVKCVITVHGHLENCRVVKGLAHMDSAVLVALSKWTYSPVTYQGRAVSVDYVIPVRLMLP